LDKKEGVTDMSFLKSLTQINPTAKGLAFVKTETFLRTLQLVAKKMLSEGQSWSEVDVQLRDITVRELLPKRNYNPDEVADFYRRNFQLVDGAWLPAVQLMKEAWLKMENDPMAFLKEQGMLPSAPAAI
jgi:hypothetical protein